MPKEKQEKKGIRKRYSCDPDILRIDIAGKKNPPIVTYKILN